MVMTVTPQRPTCPNPTSYQGTAEPPPEETSAIFEYLITGELSFHVKANDSSCPLSAQSQCPLTSPNYNDRSPQVTEQALANAYKTKPAGNIKVSRVSFLDRHDTKQLTLSHSYQHFNPFSESFNCSQAIWDNNNNKRSHGGQPGEKVLEGERKITGSGSCLCH